MLRQKEDKQDKQDNQQDTQQDNQQDTQHDKQDKQDKHLNVDNYTVEELLQILHLYQPTIFQVKDAVNTIIARMRSEKKMDVVVFFQEAQTKILQTITPATITNTTMADVKPIAAVWQTDMLHPLGDDTTTYYDNEHLPAQDKQLAEETGPKIISTRIVCIDSQYRQEILPYSTNSAAPTYITNFTFNLSNPINNTLSIRLYSYSIPSTYYAFNAQIGNTFFQYNGIIISIPDGNYTVAQLVSTINTLAQQDLASSGLLLTGPDPISGKITFTNTDPLTTDVTVIIYVQNNTTNVYACSEQLAGLFQTVGINNTLGWCLGFRTLPDPNTGDVSFILDTGESITADVQPDVSGPKYFILNVEDFSNQRLTTGLTGITNTKSQATLSVPDYYKTIDAACLLQSGNLTQAQLFSINAVLQDNDKTTLSAAAIYANKLQAPDSGSAFAFIPLANVPILRSQGNMPIVSFGANAIVFGRNYIRPIRLERIQVSLVDDKNNLVNLNDSNWNFSLIVEQQVS